MAIVLQRSRILILEDSSESIEIYRYVLGSNYDLEFAVSIEQFSKLIQVSPAPDLIIADLKVEDGCFYKFLKDSQFRIKNFTRCIVVSSVEDYSTIESLFSYGVFDYFVKPFSKVSLQVKVQRCLAQPINFSDDVMIFSSRLNLLTNSIKTETGAKSDLTLRECQLLKFFAENVHRKLTRTEIIATIWDSISVSEKTFDVHLSNLRRKLQVVNLQIKYIEPQLYWLEELSTSSEAKQEFHAKG
jgi:two-component system response regulator AdeR